MPRKLTQEEFEIRLEQIHKNNIIPLEKYKNRRTYMKCKCSICNHEWRARPDGLLSGKNCPKCAMRKGHELLTKTHEQFLQELKKITDTIIPLEEYKNGHTPIKCQCTVCNHEWRARPDGLLSGKDCPKCAGNIRKTHKQFLQELKKITDTIIPLEEYKNGRTHIKCQCTICNHEWRARPDGLLSGKDCPICASSKGEKYIQQILEKYNINFNTQYKISDCKNKQPLPFDFAIFDDSDNLLFLLEHDGKQHFEIIDYFGGEEAFQQRQLHDQIKDDYCRDNNIPLERILYSDWKTRDNLEKIILNLLNKYNS